MIVCSAIKFDYNGYPLIVCGKRHGDCFKNVSDFMSVDKWNQIGKKSVIQGFMTDDNKFLNRQQAAVHAEQCGQIKQVQETLWSEDLW